MRINLSGLFRTRRRSEQDRKRNARRVASGIFSFLLSLTLVAGSVLTAARTGVSRGGVQRCLNGAYYDILLQEITAAAEDYTLPTGIDAAALEGVFSKEELQADVTALIDAAYQNQTFKPDTTALEQRLRDNLNRIYAEHDLTLSELNAAIVAYAGDITTIYTDALKQPLVDLLVRADRLLGRYYPLGLAAITAVSLMLSAVCVALHHYLHRGLRYCCYATGGAALMLSVGPGIVWLSGIYRRVNVTPQSFHHLVTALIASLLRRCFLAALLWLAVTAVLIVIIARRRQRLMHPKHHHHSHQ